MASGGQAGIRGYLVQTLIALLDAVDDSNNWKGVTLEPNIDSDKVDILWEYPEKTKAVQVKSSQNAFRKADITRWAGELEEWRKADEYELQLIGNPESATVAKTKRVGTVAVSTFKNLDLQAFSEQAAHRLEMFLIKQGLPTGDGGQRMVLVRALSDGLTRFATEGRRLERSELTRILSEWTASVLSPAKEIASAPNMIRLIRVFVSSPGDVAAERALLDQVIARINRTAGVERDVRLEAWKWETNVVPQIGPPPQDVVDAQMPAVYDIYLGIMKHRFGTRTAKYGSGTEKEFQDALKRWGEVGKPWILFYFSGELVNPAELDLKQFGNVQRFRKRLKKLGICAEYKAVQGSDHGFYEQVDEHLRLLLQMVAPLKPGVPPVNTGDPGKYLEGLLTKASFIDIRGLQVGQERASRFPIEELYISLTTTQTAACTAEVSKKRGKKRSGKDAGNDLFLKSSQPLPLHEALCNDRLVVVGDPGAGKTTFVRRIAHALCQTELGQVPDAAVTRLGIKDRTFPILVRLNELEDHISRHRNSPSAPTGDDAPSWLVHYLSAVSEGNGWGLNGGFFRDQLEKGLCTVLLDGLDEAPDRVARERLSRLIENVAGTYKGNRLVVTSRPAGYSGEAHLADFTHAHIDPLSEQAVETFLSKWCQALYTESPEAAEDHCSELLLSLRSRPEIRRMARNPVMLTALAVVHWNERRLPEQRADLFESIIRWLSRSREQRPGREKAERAVVLLQELALAMQDHPDGMHTAVPKRWAAESIAKEWVSGQLDKGSIARAEAFVEAEELDSGIIVGRGDSVQFWHRTFQEYLVARAIAALPEADQEKLLWEPPVRVYLPEWREVMLLLAGILHQQGRAKVDYLVRTMLDDAMENNTLVEHARCAGLVGAMLRDLEPVGYEPQDYRYDEMLGLVMAIFDKERSQTVPIETRIEAADALGQAGDHRIDMKREDYWVTIDGGEFRMGAQSDDPAKRNFDSEAHERESPVHRVHLDPFRLAKYAVTVSQYQKFIEDEGYGQEQCWQAGGFGEFTEPMQWDQQVQYLSRPVVGVSWFEAAAYCRWAGVRLPTEAQWERAARGKDGRRFPWGDEDPHPSRLNYNSNIGNPTPVGVYPLDVTPEGIYDLGGNVWDWCADWYVPYSEVILSNPSVSQEASARVIRGGGWDLPSWLCRAAFRSGIEPQLRSFFLGFRVAQVPPSKSASSSNQERT